MWEKIKNTVKCHSVGTKNVFLKYGDRLLFAAALAVLAAALFRPGAEAEKAVIQVTAPRIVFTQWWREDLGKDTLENLVNEFEQLHDEIKIVLNDMSYEDLRLLLFDPNGTLTGDVTALDPLWVPELIKRETLESAEDPLLSFINVLYYNVNILKEAGFMRPPKSRGEFLAYAKAVTNAGKGRYALAIGSGSSRMIYDDVYSWIWAAGTQLINEGKAAVNSRQGVESLSFLASLAKEGLIIPGAFAADTSITAAADSAKKLDDFVSGKAAFMIAPAGEIRRVRERMSDESFGISSVPAPDNYPLRSYYGTAAWTAGVISGSEHKEEAALFTAFLAEKAPFLSEKAGAIPGGASIPPGHDPFYSKVWDIAIAGENAQDFSGLACEHELEEIFREEIAALFAEKTGPAEAAGAIQKRWDETLSKPRGEIAEQNSAAETEEEPQSGGVF